MNIILLALPIKSLGFHCLFHFHNHQFGSVFTKNTYYYYLTGTVLNPAHILMISCTSYLSSYNPLFINILVSRTVIPSLLSTDPGLEAPPGGQQQKLPFPLPYFFPLWRTTVHLSFLVLLIIQLIHSQNSPFHLNRARYHLAMICHGGQSPSFINLR